jgi:hypothetical protein
LNEPFDVGARAILIRARLVGPNGVAEPLLALDTGATTTWINTEILRGIGCEILPDAERAFITTAIGIERIPKVPVHRVEAIGQKRDSMLVLAGNLPPTAGIDGLLGLDFLRRHRLVVDFRKGRISLT